MSFGFSVGDFIAAIQLANKIRKEFANSPGQFKAISDEVRSLSIVLQDADIAYSERELKDSDKKDLEDISKGCQNNLNELERILDKYVELGYETKGVGKRVKRTWKRLKWEPEDIKELRSRITANIGLLNAFTGRLTRDNVITLVRHQDDQARQTILTWITPTDYASQQRDFISRRQSGTGQWLLESDKFQAWLATKGQTLFCPGIPGAGKTILTSTVVAELIMRFQHDNTIGIAYLYCNFRFQHSQKLGDLLASLLKQLIQKQLSLPDRVKALYSQHKNERTRLSHHEILELLHFVASIYSRLFIIIDALDECQANECRMKLLQEIFRLQAKYGANLFATSRAIPEIQSEFEKSVTLEIRASRNDVQRYIDGNISRFRPFVARNPALQDEIKTVIVEAVDGMFLLVQLHLDSLVDKTTPKGIKVALKAFQTKSKTKSDDNTPKALDNAYTEAMERIESQGESSQGLAKQAILWIVCTRKPLTVSELQHALAVEINEAELDLENLPEIEDIISVCAGLVTVDEESNIIRLVHYTTQEYFQRAQKRWFPDAEADITKICVTYLSFNVFDTGFCVTDKELEARLEQNSFYCYAAQNWGFHAGAASSALPEHLIQRFFGREPKTSACAQAMIVSEWQGTYSNYSQDVPKQMTGLHIAAYFGLRDLVAVLLDHGHNPNCEDSNGRTPLSWAAGIGHDAVVELLLETGAKLEANDSLNGQTPLSWAAGNGHNKAVKLLLKNGANLESKDSKYGRTPLSWATRNGFDVVVKSLLEAGAEIESQSVYRRTPLIWAADNGHGAVAKLLLEKGAKVEAKDSGYGRTPLSWAVGSGNDAIVKLLLERGADLESRDSYNRTPLSWASRNGHAVIAKLLLENGAELESKSSSRGTPLFYAAEKGLFTVVKVLLEEGAALECKASSYNRTPLSSAAGNGYDTVVGLLLDKGADLECRDSNNGQTPLSLAAENGHEAVVKLLLEKGANLEPKDSKYGRGPLSWASQNGNIGVVNLLLEKSAQLESKDNSGRTPLSWAAGNGHVAITEKLIEHGADLKSEDKIGQTPLSWASRNGRRSITKLLRADDQIDELSLSKDEGVSSLSGFQFF